MLLGAFMLLWSLCATWSLYATWSLWVCGLLITATSERLGVPDEGSAICPFWGTVKYT